MSPRIKVIGIGGGGSNAVTRMVREEIPGVQIIVVDTSTWDLRKFPGLKVPLGSKILEWGAGGDPAVGCRAAQESREELRQVCKGADMVFITAGMGGGTGSGAVPVVAELCKESGALTIAVVTKPFSFEGMHRRLQAEEGLAKLAPHVDTLIAIPNDRLLQLCDSKTVVDNAFRLAFADEVLCQAVASIASVITTPGLINLDFADIKSVMKGSGPAWLSIGKGKGTNRSTDAAKAALASPLLDVSIEGARGVLYNITGSSNLTLNEVNEAAAIIAKAVDPSANIIFGVVFDPRKENEVNITLVATGFRTKSSSGPKIEDVKQLMKGIDPDSEIDVPSFLRRPLTLRRERGQR